MDRIKERLQLLREEMRQKNIAAVIVPGTDPHASEYIASHWKEREWISGFNGSAGTVVIAENAAALWTDSRYFLQAEQQLKESGFELKKEGEMNTPDIPQWLESVLPKRASVAVNPQFFSVNVLERLQSDLEQREMLLRTEFDFIGMIWSDRPSLPKDKLFELPDIYNGKTVIEKLSAVRSQMRKKNCDFSLYSGLDEIAWLFNIRGTDVNYNPVVISYAVVEQKGAKLFVDISKLTEEAHHHLLSQGVSVCDYLKINGYLASFPANSVLAMDFNKINYALFQTASCVKKNVPSVVMAMKSIKNETELAGIRSAMIRDGVAMVRFLRWLELSVSKGNLSEISVAEKLYDFRSQQQFFVGESFGTISGYGAHGAIVHYSATSESNAILKPEGFLLLDSGGQYFDGTTDITRTIPLGTLSEQQKHDFTLVLKGHIALSMAKFPYGTRGTQLDVLARQFLWQNALNYGHGTGHGVGHFLCVHEGPQNIRMEENPTRLEPGMILSNEPGVYRENEYGIRIENLVAVVEKEETNFGRFLGFETLTLCPIDKKAILFTMLSDAERIWLNNYHQTVYDRISPLLNDQERLWLQDKTAGI